MITLLLPLLAAATAAAPLQSVSSCQGTDPRLERLAKAVERGDISVVRAHVDSGADPNETWRDSRNPTLCRSLLLRTIWYGQDEMFQLLLQRGADPLLLPRESLEGAVRSGRVEIVRALFGFGLKPLDNDEIFHAGLASKSLPMLDLLLSSGVSIRSSNLPPYYLTDDITRFLVPRYVNPNDEMPLGLEACDVQKLFGLLRKDQDGCEWTTGPMWLHYVLTGRYEMVQFMISNGADLTLRSEVWDGGGTRPFTAMDVATKRKDRRMADLLRQAGAPAR